MQITARDIDASTAARLSTAVGHYHLICWSLGAQSMTAYTQRRPPEALDLARQASEYVARTCALGGLVTNHA